MKDKYIDISDYELGRKHGKINFEGVDALQWDEYHGISTAEQAKAAYENAKKKIDKVTAKDIYRDRLQYKNAFADMINKIQQMNPDALEDIVIEEDGLTIRDAIELPMNSVMNVTEEELQGQLSIFAESERIIIYACKENRNYRAYFNRLIRDRAQKLYRAYQATYNTSYSPIYANKAITATRHLKSRNVQQSYGIQTVRYKGVEITSVGISEKPSAVIGQTLDIISLIVAKDYPHFDKSIHPDDLTDDQILLIESRRRLEITVAEYKKLRNLSDYKTAKEELEKSLQDLSHLKYVWKETRKIKRGNGKPIDESIRFELPPISPTTDGERYIKNGTAIITLTSEFAKYLAQGTLKPYAVKLLTVNNREYPHAYHIGNALVDIMNMEKKTDKTVKVSKLLEELPLMPKESDIKNRHYTERIIEPLEHNLEYLKNDIGFLKSWSYCNQYGISAEKELSTMSYNDWKNLYIEFELSDFPKDPIINKV